MIRAMLCTSSDQLSGTTKTQLNGAANITMPAWARQIETVIPFSCNGTPTADETNSGIITLESDDVAIVPYEIPYPPSAGFDATSGTAYNGELKGFPIHCPLKGGEEIAVYGTADIDNSTEPYTGVGLVVTDQKTDRQYFSKMGTATASGTAAAEVAGTAYSIHGCEEVRFVLGYVVDATKAANNGFAGNFRLYSNDFKVAVPLKYPFNTIGGAESTVEGPYIQPSVRWAVNIPTNTTCTIQDYCTFHVAPAAAGKFRSGVMFNKVGR